MTEAGCGAEDEESPEQTEDRAYRAADEESPDGYQTGAHRSANDPIDGAQVGLHRDAPLGEWPFSESSLLLPPPC